MNELYRGEGDTSRIDVNNSEKNIPILLISMHKNIQNRLEYTNIQRTYAKLKLKEYATLNGYNTGFRNICPCWRGTPWNERTPARLTRPYRGSLREKER